MQANAFDQSIVDTASKLAVEVFAPAAADIDRAREFPDDNFTALYKSGLLGLLVPKAMGGLDASDTTYVEVIEKIGSACASTAMCFVMHNCGIKTLVAGGTPSQHERLLPRMKDERIIATLAVSEPGIGSHFYRPEMKTVVDGDSIVLNGTKTFTTSGDRASWYLVYTAPSPGVEGGNWILVERGTSGLSFEGEWDGMGMAGNNSINSAWSNVRVRKDALIGETEGVGEAVHFQDTARTFILGISAANIGIAQSALDYAIAHAKERDHSIAGGKISSHQAIRFYLTEMLMRVEGARCALHKAIGELEGEHPNAARSLFCAKIAACETSRRVTDLALQICGGQGYRKARPVERWFRDARAGAVMGPTSEVLTDWVGKMLLDMPPVDA